MLHKSNYEGCHYLHCSLRNSTATDTGSNKLNIPLLFPGLFSQPSTGTWETLGGHLHFLWDTPESLVFQLRLSFICSFLNHTSSTCGSLDQQRVQWMLHKWLISGWRLASTEHSLIRRFSAKALPILVPLISFQCHSFHSVVSSQTLPVHFPCPKYDQWLNEEGPHSCPCQSSCYPNLSGRTIYYFLRILHFFIQVQLHFIGHIGQPIVYL